MKIPSSFANQNFHFPLIWEFSMQDSPRFYPKCQHNLKLKNQLMCTCQSIARSHGKFHDVGAGESEPIWSGLLKKNQPGRPSEIICFAPEHSSVSLTAHNHTRAKAPSVLLIFFPLPFFLIPFFYSFVESKTVKWPPGGYWKREKVRQPHIFSFRVCPSSRRAQGRTPHCVQMCLQIASSHGGKVETKLKGGEVLFYSTSLKWNPSMDRRSWLGDEPGQFPPPSVDASCWHRWSDCFPEAPVEVSINTPWKKKKKSCCFAVFVRTLVWWAQIGSCEVKWTP